MAILYPIKKPFLSLQWGINIKEKDLDSCYIFNTSLKKVQDEAQRLVNNADLESNVNQKETSECFSCGIKADNLSRCANCKLAKYCSRVRYQQTLLPGKFSLTCRYIYIYRNAKRKAGKVVIRNCAKIARFY